jgi:hypothetical protein
MALVYGKFLIGNLEIASEMDSNIERIRYAAKYKIVFIIAGSASAEPAIFFNVPHKSI